MAAPTEEQKHQLDRKSKRIESHRQGISAKKRVSKGISKREFHDVLDKASQPIENNQIDK